MKPGKAKLTWLMTVRLLRQVSMDKILGSFLICFSLSLSLSLSLGCFASADDKRDDVLRAVDASALFLMPRCQLDQGRTHRGIVLCLPPAL